ncbi:hypothetical protein [Endozoicomonas lisbonensis]|uniref:hypothetical protein n=1 Tax=Endozoicomonas lisbonensis TaxID=3120522 RepID=UPI0033988E6E
MINSTPLSSQLSSQPATPEVRTVNPAKKSDEPVAVEHTPFLTWKRDHRSRPLPDYRVKVLDEPVADPLQVKPELPIVLESPPLPEMAGIPDALKAPFTKNLISLVEQLKQEQYEKGIEQCKKLRKFAECKQHLDTPEIMQFLDSLYVLFSLSLGKKEVIDQLHTADPDTFIRWHLDIAASAAPGSDNKAKAAINSDTAAKAKADTDPAPLKPPKELELYCLRRAADAGSQTARQHLVLQLLFGQEDQKPDVYLPEEALRYIKAMATEQGEPPQPLVMGHHGAVIRKLVKLATNPTTEDREALTKELAEDSDPNIQALAVALYLKPLFGATDIDRALAEANTLNSAPDSHPHLRYWQALAQLKKGEPALVEQAEASLEKLVRQNYPAAIRVATEHYMRVGNIFKVDTFVVGTKDNGVPVEYCPDLAHTLATACEYLETEVKTVPLGWSTPGEKKEMRQNYKNIAISHCCPEARLASLASLTMDIPKKNRPKPSRDEPVEKTCLPEHARDLLHQCRFSEDPETLVFIYLDQLQQTGKSDEKLLDLAMAMDPVRTCCRMLALKVYSEKWSYQALTTKLYSLINDVADLPEDWQQKPSQKALYYGLTGPHHTLTPDCEKYFRLASQLAYGYQSLTPDETGIYDDLKERYAKFLMHQGKPEAAKRMFSSYEKTNKSLARGYDASTKVPEDYSVFQKDLPACYWDLTTFETKSDSTPVASFKYQKLLDLQQTIASHPDPALHQAWSETCRYFLDSSGKHLTNEQIMDLSQRMIRCQQQVDSLTASMLNQSRQMIEARAEQLALTQGSSEPLERIRNQWGQVTFPGVPRKNLAAADSGQSSQRRLPERRPNSQVMEHHLEAPLRAAETAEERLELLQQLLAKGTFNTPVITTLALEAIETLPPERHEEALECLSQLAKRLTDDVLRLANRFRQSLCEHIQALHVILYDPPERRHCEALALRLEDMKICAGAVNLRQLSEVLHPAALYRERGLHNQVIAASEPFAEQLDRMLSSIDEPKAFVDYARYLAGKTLSHEETRALQELPEKVREQQKPLAKLLSDYVLGKRCKGHILRTAANTKIFLDFRVDPLSIGLEAGIISAREVRQNARWFDSNSVYSNVLYALSANTIEELKDYHGKLETSTRMNSKDCKKMCRDKYFVALGFKSLKMGDFKLAYNCFKNGSMRLRYGYAGMEAQQGVTD